MLDDLHGAESGPGSSRARAAPLTRMPSRTSSGGLRKEAAEGEVSPGTLRSAQLFISMSSNPGWRPGRCPIPTTSRRPRGSSRPLDLARPAEEAGPPAGDPGTRRAPGDVRRPSPGLHGTPSTSGSGRPRRPRGSGPIIGSLRSSTGHVIGSWQRPGSTARPRRGRPTRWSGEGVLQKLGQGAAAGRDIATASAREPTVVAGRSPSDPTVPRTLSGWPSQHRRHARSPAVAARSGTRHPLPVASSPHTRAVAGHAFVPLISEIDIESEIMGELLTRMFFGGFVRLHVLYHAVREPVFGVEMMEELARHGYDVGRGHALPDAPPARGGGLPELADRGRRRQDSGSTTGPRPRGRRRWRRPRRSSASWSRRSSTMIRRPRRSDRSSPGDGEMATPSGFGSRPRFDPFDPREGHLTGRGARAEPMNPIVFAMRRPLTVMVLVVAVALGSVPGRAPDADRHLPEPEPARSSTSAQPYGGMDPAQMEGLLTNYYEYHFLYINGIHHVESRNIQGMALMKLFFHPGTNMAQAMAETIGYVTRSRAFMPPGTVSPFITRFDAGSVPGRLPRALERDEVDRRDPGPGAVQGPADVREPAGRLGAAAVRRQPADGGRPRRPRPAPRPTGCRPTR